MRLKQPRIQPLATEAIPEELRSRLGAAPSAPVLNVFATLAQHPGLAKRWLVFGAHVLGKSTLSPRDRELLILRTGWLHGSEYEWGQHASIALTCGISEAEILRVTQGADAQGWSVFDAALLRAVDELHVDSVISDATWNTLAGTYGKEQLLDLIFTVGQYTMVSMFLNSCGVQLEPGVKGWPDGARDRARK